MPEPEVSIIIVNFNGIEFLEECLQSVRSAFVKYTSEIIVVDNNSNDGSKKFLELVQGIKYIQSNSNLGFAGGNNLGAQHAVGSVLLLLNNDTKVVCHLDKLVDQLKDERVGAVGCRLVYGDGRQQHSIGYQHTPLRIVFSWMGLAGFRALPNIFRRVVADNQLYEKRQESVDWISGACLATRKLVWERVGGLDSRFFMYCEDVDYCAQLRNLNYVIKYEPTCLVIHYEGSGKVWIGKAALQRTARSYLIFLRKYYSDGVSRFTGIALSLVFACRAFALLTLAILSRNPTILIDKSKAYQVVARKLLLAGLTGRLTELE